MEDQEGPSVTPLVQHLPTVLCLTLIPAPALFTGLRGMASVSMCGEGARETRLRKS